MRRWLLDFSVSAPGGADIYAAGFLGALAAAGSPEGADVTVLLPPAPALLEQGRELADRGFRVHHVDHGPAGSWRARLGRQVLIPVLSWRWRSDVVFVPREAAPVICRGQLVVLARNRKVWDRGVLPGGRGRTSAVALNLVARLAAWRAQRVLVVSATFGASLPVPRTKLAVVHHGCDLVPTAPLRPVDEALNVVCIGTLSRHKRFDVAIRGVASMRRAGIAADLTIWGGPGSPGEEERLSQLGRSLQGTDPVRGPLLPDQRATAYQAADVLFVGSSYESFGLPLVEAMRTSTLVLAPASPLVDELCGPVAATYAEGDGQDAARALVEALPHFASAAADGLARSADFTWRRCVELTVQELRRCG